MHQKVGALRTVDGEVGEMGLQETYLYAPPLLDLSHIFR